MGLINERGRCFLGNFVLSSGEAGVKRGREVCSVGYGMDVWSVTVIIVVSCVLVHTGLSR